MSKWCNSPDFQEKRRQANKVLEDNSLSVFEKLGRVWDLCCWGFGFPDDYPELNSVLRRAIPFGQTRTLFRWVKREDQGDVEKFLSDSKNWNYRIWR